LSTVIEKTLFRRHFVPVMRLAFITAPAPRAPVLWQAERHKTAVHRLHGTKR